MPYAYSCPHCRSTCGIADAAVGGLVRCPICGESFQPPDERIAAGSVGATDPVRHDDAVKQRRPRPIPRGRSGRTVALILTLGGIAVVSALCLAGLVGLAFYALLVAPQANAPLVAARPAVHPEFAPPLPAADIEAPPEFAAPALQPGADHPPVELPAALLSARPDELIRNGDFEQGPKGFRSAYRHSPGNLRNELTFCIAHSPRDAHSEAAAFGDHTGGHGLMMAVNGGDAVNRVLWGQTVVVRPHADYTFSLWLTSWYPTSPGRLEVRIDGKVLGTTVAPTRCGEWTEFKMPWRSGADRQAIIEIVNQTRDISGNDFAIDDISLRGPRPDAPMAGE